MEHKAFAFDWDGFAASLLPVLRGALITGDTTGLLRHIEANRERLRDPYEGQPLEAGWQESLENGDAHELGDYAITEFYDPLAPAGLGEAWTALSEAVDEDAQLAFLGWPLGSAECRFDPGRMGSYFQTPTEIPVSLRAIDGLDQPEIEPFRELLRLCAEQGKGLYITF